ncbi:hypothetical protein [Photorhabdus thracensis]|uniref:hypothetical protein n=1 Tax=Photorhabdus thracensis TaxID=230089 RepID=UPI0030D8B391|nr:hypothetical protein [Photorhabdus thracensis]
MYELRNQIKHSKFDMLSFDVTSQQPMTPATSLAPAIKDIASAQKTTFATTQE